MSIIGLATGKQPQRMVISRDAADAPGLTIDATLKFSINRRTETTKLPVESGADITDHIKRGNFEISLEAVISEAPLPFDLTESALGILAGIAGGRIGTLVGGQFSSLVTAGAAIGANFAKNFALSPNVEDGAKLETQIANRDLGDDDFPRKAYEYLIGLQEKGELVKITSRFKNFEQLVITGISTAKTSKDGKSLMFSMDLEQVQIVTSATVAVPENILAADAAGASSKANLGKKSTGAASAKQGENVSILKSIFK